MQVFSEKVSLGSVGSATGSATGSVGSVEGTKIAIYGAGSVGSVATMGMVARLRNIVLDGGDSGSSYLVLCHIQSVYTL